MSKTLVEEGITASSVPGVGWEMWEPVKAISALRDQERFGKFANRCLRLSKVEQYARDIRARRWALTGEPVIFTDDGRLLNGQHRLHAIARAGVGAVLLTVRGIDPGAMTAMDIGLIRTPGDTVRNLPGIGGYYNAWAAAARIVFSYTRFGVVAPSPLEQPTRAEIVAINDAHPRLIESVKWLSAKQEAPWLRMKTAAAWHYLCGRRYPSERDAFFGDLVAGVNLGPDRPVRVLRERLIAASHGPGRLGAATWSAFIIKSWNAELTGRPLKILRHGSAEAFPLLVGDVVPARFEQRLQVENDPRA